MSRPSDTTQKNRRFLGDWFFAGLAATLLSGIPSTMYAWATGGDVTEATRAAGAMLISPASSLGELLLAAALVHTTISFFWAAILVRILPQKFTLSWALLAALAIGVLDLLVIAPPLFPSVAALDFWPQMADHLMWGAVLAAVLHFRWRRSAS